MFITRKTEEWRQEGNSLVPSTSEIDTLAFPGRNVKMASSTEGYDLNSLYNFDSLDDVIGSASTMELTGANATLDTVNREVTLNGADCRSRILGITGDRDIYSLQIRMKYDTMNNGTFTMIYLNNGTAYSSNTTNEIGIRHSFGNIQVRVRSTDTGFVTYNDILSMNSFVGSGYFNFWIIRSVDKFTFAISDGSAFYAEEVFDAPGLPLDVSNLRMNFGDETNTLTGGIERIVVFKDVLDKSQRDEIEGITAKDSQSSYETSFVFDVERDIDMNGNRLMNIGEPVVAGDVANKSYVDNAVGDSSGVTQMVNNSDGLMLDTSGTTVAVNNKRVTGVLIPSGGTDAANKNYVDAFEPPAIQESDGVAQMVIKTLNEPVFGNPANTLANGTGNSGRLALAASDTIRMVFGGTNGYYLDGKGGAGSFYYNGSVVDPVANLTVRETDTLFNKDIDMIDNDINNVKTISATTLSGDIDTGLITASGSGGGAIQLSMNSEILRFTEQDSIIYFQKASGNTFHIGGPLNSSTGALLKIGTNIDIETDLNMKANKIENVATPTDTSPDTDVANKKYVDDEVAKVPFSKEVWFRVENIAYNTLSAGAFIPKADIKTNWDNSWFNNTTYEFQVLNNTDPILTFEVDAGYQIDNITGNVVDRAGETGVPKLLALKEGLVNKYFVRAYDLETANSTEFSFCIRVNISEIPV